MTKTILISAIAGMLAGSAQATLIQFGNGGSGNNPAAPDDGATSAISWRGEYTNFVTGVSSTGNGTLEGQGAGAMLVDPLATMTMTAVFASNNVASTANDWGALRRAIGVSGGLVPDAIDENEGFEFTFSSDVNLEYLRFRSWGSGDEATISLNGVALPVMTSSTLDTSVFLAAGDVLRIEQTGTYSPSVAGSANIQLTSLVVDVIIPEPSTLGLFGIAAFVLLGIRRMQRVG